MSAAAGRRLSWTRLPLLVVLAVLPQLCFAIDYTARLTNPDFEDGADVPGWTKWSFGAPFDNYYATSPAPPERAPSGVLYLHIGGNGTTVQQPNSGTFACQSVDLTGIDTIAFRYTNISDVGSFNVKPTVRIDDTVVFQGISGVYFGDFATGSVDVSGYTGTHVLRFGTQTCTDQTFVGGGSLFDDIRLSSGSLLGGPVMNPEPSQTPGTYNEVSWTYDARSAGLRYQVVCDNDADCSSPEMTSDWQTEMSHTFGPLAYGLTAYYRVRARIQTVVPLWLDTFEDGNLDGWTQGAAGASWAVTNETAANGTSYSVRCIGGDSNRVLLCSFTKVTPDTLVFYVRAAKTDAVQGDLYVQQDSQPITYFRMLSDGRMVVYSRTSAGSLVTYPLGSYESLRWYKISIRFNWSAQSVDAYVDDELRAQNVPFYYSATAITGVTRVVLYNRTASVAWWDQIMMFNGEPTSYYSDWSNVVHSTQVQDTTPPVCAITAPEDGQRCCYLASVTGTASDPGGEAASGVASVRIELRRDNAGIVERWNYMDGQWVTTSVPPIYAAGTTDWSVSYLPLEWDTTLIHQVVAVARDVAGNDSAPAVVAFTPIGQPDPPILAELPATTTGDNLTLHLTDPNYPPCDEYRIQLANSDQFSPVYDTGWITRGALTGGAASLSGAGGELRVDGSRVARAGLPAGLSLLGLGLGLALIPALGRGRGWRPRMPLRGRRGFVVTELLVNLAIIAILAAILIPFTVSARVAGQRTRQSNELLHIVGPPASTSGSVQWTQEGDQFCAKGRDGLAVWPLPALPPGGPLPELVYVRATMTASSNLMDSALLRVAAATTPDGSPSSLLEVLLDRYAKAEFRVDSSLYKYGNYYWNDRASDVGLDFLPGQVVFTMDGSTFASYSTAQQLFPRSVAIGIGSGQMRGTSPPIYVDTRVGFSDLEVSYQYRPRTLTSDWSNIVHTYWSTNNLLLSNLRVGRITATSAVVNWETTLPSSSEVAYGTESAASFGAYPNRAAEAGSTTHHSVMLTNLAPDTTYYLRAGSQGSAQWTTSDEISFKTPPLPKLQPTLVYCGDIECVDGGVVTLAARLSHEGAPLAGASIRFVCSGAAYRAITGADGIATGRANVASLGPGNPAYVSIYFEGDDEYLPAHAEALITIDRATGTKIEGTGKFYRDGGTKGLCQFSFSFVDALPPTGTLSYRDLKEGLRIDGIVVDKVVVDGARATISFHVGAPAVSYTLTVNAATDYFYLVRDSGGYAAGSGHSSKDKIDIRME